MPRALEYCSTQSRTLSKRRGEEKRIKEEENKKNIVSSVTSKGDKVGNDVSLPTFRIIQMALKICT